MPDPEKGSFQLLSPKGPAVEVGEEFEFRLTPDAIVQLRLQAIERTLSRIPIVGQDYTAELKRAGLQRLDLRSP